MSMHFMKFRNVNMSMKIGNLLSELVYSSPYLTDVVVAMADSGGITAAGFVSLILEPLLCGYQVNDGRPWCRMT
jgi:hypothetical protein